MLPFREQGMGLTQEGEVEAGHLGGGGGPDEGEAGALMKGRLVSQEGSWCVSMGGLLGFQCRGTSVVQKYQYLSIYVYSWAMWPQYDCQGSQPCWSFLYGHTWLETPDPVRSPKLSNHGRV